MITLGVHENSPLRYPGGKARRAIRLLRFADTGKRNYVEPFAGGLGMLFRARRERIFRKYWVNDLDDRLVNFWIVLRDRVDELEQRLWRLYRVHGSGDETIFESSKEDLKHDNPVTRAAAYFIVNKWSVKGDTGGNMLVSTKRRSGISPRMLDSLAAYSELLEGVRITNEDFREVVAPSDSFFFLDPPYEAFSERFYQTSVDLTDLRDYVQSMPSSFLMTLNDSDFTNDLFAAFDRVVEPVLYPVLLGSNHEALKRRPKSELVVMNYRRTTHEAFIRRFGWELRPGSPSLLPA